MPLDRITPEEVERYKTLRSSQSGLRTKRKLKPATVNRELACLKAAFNYAIRNDVPLRNPVSRVKFLAAENEQTRVLEYAEQERYLAFATPTLRDIATIMLETGMRPEEVYRIRREDVHLSSGFLVIPYGKTKAAKRRVPLSTSARAVIVSRLASIQGGYLFPCETDSSRPVPKINNAHDRAVITSGVWPFRLYDLRHTWATRAAMAGIDLVTLAAMLGHSRIQMVMRYTHPTHSHQNQAMQRLEQFVSDQRADAAYSAAQQITETIQ